MLLRLSRPSRDCLGGLGEDWVIGGAIVCACVSTVTTLSCKLLPLLEVRLIAHDDGYGLLGRAGLMSATSLSKMVPGGNEVVFVAFCAFLAAALDSLLPGSGVLVEVAPEPLRSGELGNSEYLVCESTGDGLDSVLPLGLVSTGGVSGGAFVGIFGTAATSMSVGKQRGGRDGGSLSARFKSNPPRVPTKGAEVTFLPSFTF